jgi:hypothetical protein
MVNDQVRYQQQVNGVRMIGWIENHECAAVVAPGHGLRMRHSDPPAVGQMNDERPERLGLMQFL